MSLLLSGVIAVVDDRKEQCFRQNELYDAAKMFVDKPIVVDRDDVKVGRVVRAWVEGDAIAVEAYVPRIGLVGETVCDAILAGKLAYFEYYVLASTLGTKRRMTPVAVSLESAPGQSKTKFTYAALPAPKPSAEAAAFEHMPGPTPVDATTPAP